MSNPYAKVWKESIGLSFLKIINWLVVIGPRKLVKELIVWENFFVGF